ncbi:MAG: energy transducer TonB [Prevotella sp.]
MNPTRQYNDYDSGLSDFVYRRRTNILLGLIVALSVSFVALEYSMPDSKETDFEDVLDDMTQDIEIFPMLNRQDIPSAVSSTKPIQQTQIVAVDKEAAGIVEDNIVGEDNIGDNDLSAVTETNKADVSSSVAEDNHDNPLGFQEVESLPEFPGGMSELMQWLTKTLKYPLSAQKAKIQGTVLIAFIINTDGTITSPKIVTSVCDELDNEALRVIRMMPKWKPGKDHGKPCRTYFRIPIVFKL